MTTANQQIEHTLCDLLRCASSIRTNSDFYDILMAQPEEEAKEIPITGTYPFVDENGTTKNLCGAIDLGQIKTIGKERIVSKKVCDLSVEMKDVDIKLLNVLGLSSLIKKKDNLIQSLMGKIVYLKEQIEEKKEE